MVGYGKADYSEAARERAREAGRVNRSAFEFELRACAAAQWMAAALHGAALLPLWLAALPPGAGAALTLLILVSLATTLRRFHASRWVSLTRGDREAPWVTIRDARGGHAVGALHGSTFVSGALVIVRFRPSGAWRCGTLVVPLACTGAEVHRRLRAWLRWSAAPALDPGRAGEPKDPDPVPHTDDGGGEIPHRFGGRYT